MADLLPILYQKIADLTAPSCQNGTAECAKFCDRKYRCCERQYCEATRRFAKENYNIDLEESGNSDLPFMGENGCTVAPHLRPICAIHLCSFAWPDNGEQTGPEGFVELWHKVLAEAKRQGKDPFSCL